MNKNLISCSDCGREVSKNAASCPNCGKSMKTSPVNILATVVLLIGALVAVGFVIKSFNFSIGQSKTDIKGEIFISENGQNFPLETILVRAYQTDKIQKLTDDQIELEMPDVLATTSADGNFTMKIPNGDYTVIANGSRAVNKQIEYYHWKLPITVSNEEAKLILNNQNLSGE